MWTKKRNGGCGTVGSRTSRRYPYFPLFFFNLFYRKSKMENNIIVRLHLLLSRAWNLTAEQFCTVQSRLLPGQIPIRWNFLVKINKKFLVRFSSKETRQNANPRLRLSTVFAFFCICLLLRHISNSHL